MEVVAVGTSKFLLGFALSGVKTVLANGENVIEHIGALENAGIIILESSLLDALTHVERERLETSVTPVIITLSEDGAEETTRLKHMIKNTLGVDLFK